MSEDADPDKSSQAAEQDARRDQRRGPSGAELRFRVRGFRVPGSGWGSVSIARYFATLNGAVARTVSHMSTSFPPAGVTSAKFQVS